MPDTLHLKASRANLTVEQWAAAHPDWIGWSMHAEREDVVAFRAAQARTGRPEADQGDAGSDEHEGPQQRIPVEGAMEQALAVMAGRVQATDVVPVYAGEEAR